MQSFEHCLALPFLGTGSGFRLTSVYVFSCSAATAFVLGARSAQSDDSCLYFRKTLTSPVFKHCLSTVLSHLF